VHREQPTIANTEEKMKRGNAGECRATENELPENLSKRLVAYALAATATAGLGLTAAAAPAEASIISHTTSLGLSCPMPGIIAQLDVSITKSFQLDFGEGCQLGAAGVPVGSLTVTPTPFAAGRLATSAGKWFVGSAPMAARLGKGSPVGLQGFDVASGPVPILAFRGSLVPSSDLFIGHWAPSGAGYLGFEFGPTGGEHFGWVAMSVAYSYSTGFAAHITGYAYDTVAGQNIDAGQTSAVPEPGTLALLALGAMGLMALRKRKLARETN
jgi:hypothetical protein